MGKFLIFSSHDAAAGFVTELEGSRTPWKRVERALRHVVAEEYLEIDECCRSLVAAETVAAARGWPHKQFPPELMERPIVKHRTELAMLSGLALQVVRRLLSGKNELYEPRENDYLAQSIKIELDDLMVRIERQANLSATAAILKQRTRLRPGDVFRIPLTKGKTAHCRLYEEGDFYVYSEIRGVLDPPPIGSRDFLFYGGVHKELQGLIGTDACMIVGRDPFSADEPRRAALYKAPRRDPGIYGGAGPLKEIYATAFQCIGMEAMCHFTLEVLQDRISRRETSVQRSLGRLGPYLSAVEIERALSIQCGRSCRHFDADENRAFGLIE